MSVSSSEATLRYQGPLEKQGKIMKSSWKKYWFILHDDQLIYYKEDAKSRASGKRTSSSSNQGEIQLCHVLTIKESNNINHGYAFELTTKSRSHILSAETAELRSNWVKILHEAMLLKKRHSSIIALSKTSSKSIGDVDEEDDGMYDAVDFNDNKDPPVTSNNQQGVVTRKSQVGALMSVTGEARCYSDVFDDHYQSVYDSKSPEDCEDDEDDCYAEVNDAIRTNGEDTMIQAYAEAEGNSQNTEQQRNNSVSNSLTIQDDESQGAYTYVQMRKKSALDYRAPAKVPSGVSSRHFSSDMDNQYSETTAEANDENRTSARFSNSISRSSESNFPPYSKVKSKKEREKGDGYSSKNAYDPVIMPNSDSEDNSQDEYDEVLTYDRKSYHPDLPHPRLELTAASAFDKIRLFIAEHRGPNEVYKTSSDLELGGAAVENLRKLLKELDMKNVSENRGGRIQSTHL